MEENLSRSTDGLPGPHEFPIGSPESRAAARALLASRDSRIDRQQIILDLPRRGGEAGHGTGIGPWWPTDDGGLVRVIIAPSGEVSEEELERLLATP